MSRDEDFFREFRAKQKVEFINFAIRGATLNMSKSENPGAPEPEFGKPDSDCGQSIDILQLLAYMEARFVLLECLDLAQKILHRKLRLADVEFMMTHGSLPVMTTTVAKCHEKAHSTSSSEPMRDSASSNTNDRDSAGGSSNSTNNGSNFKSAWLGQRFRQLAPLFRTILHDERPDLNVCAYRLATSAFRGIIQQRLLKLECILLTLILEQQFGFATNQQPIQQQYRTENSTVPESTLGWLRCVAESHLQNHRHMSTVTEQMQLIAAIRLLDTLRGIRAPLTATTGGNADGFMTVKLHFTACPQLLHESFASESLVLRNGMVEVRGLRNISIAMVEAFGHTMSLLSRTATKFGAGSGHINTARALQVALLYVQHCVHKGISVNKDKHKIASLLQLQRDRPLLPPCIYALLERLEQQGRLDNTDRYNLLVFLKNVGLPLRFTEDLMRSIYSRNVEPSAQWTTHRAGHLRRVYRYEKRHQLGCAKFDRYCVWRRGADQNRRILAKIRHGQQDVLKKAPLERSKTSDGFADTDTVGEIEPPLRKTTCSVEDFRSLLKAVGNSRGPDEARSCCAKLGCFQDSTVPFYSPLGYYYNCKPRFSPHPGGDGNDLYSW